MPNEIPQIPVGDLPAASSTDGITLLVIQDDVCKRLSLGAVEDDISESLPDIPAGSDANPLMDGTVSAGSSSNWSRADHVHPKDTSKQDVLTFDSSPQAGSNNPVKSSGIYGAIRSRRVNIQPLYQYGSPELLDPNTPTTIPLTDAWERYDFLLCYFSSGEVYGALLVPTFSLMISNINPWWPVAVEWGNPNVKIAPHTNNPAALDFYGYRWSPPESGGDYIWVYAIYGIV